ncbi:uncharacterized protein LOC132599575 [Lycium barbarum]|uniref:uncharacterized protein LOC132599575 n=1 Tax=Lycium barbarum TaxID=112863 RepID=UPI00293E8666|nr:uncharacterized protein LOC132599575 [Lycium barbarum]
MFIKLVKWKKKADELMFHTLIRVHPQVIQQHPARVMRGIRLINWFILLFGVISVILLFYCFFTSAVKLLGISTGSGSRNITVYNMNQWWTENRKMATSNNDQWTENDTDYFDVSILASETTANFKTPLVLMPEQQLTNNLDASSPIGVDNGISCLAVDLVQEMNTEND